MLIPCIAFALIIVSIIANVMRISRFDRDETGDVSHTHPVADIIIESLCLFATAAGVILLVTAAGTR